MRTRMNNPTSPLLNTVFSVGIMVLLWLLNSTAQAQTFTARVDRTQVSMNETFNLVVRYSGSTQSQPDFSALTDQFEILNQSTSNQIRNSNGSVESHTEWSMVLLPRGVGRLVVPSFKFDNAFTDAIVISVSANAPLPAGQQDDIFVETILNTTSSHVQEQILLTYQLFYSVNIEGLENPAPVIENAIVEPLERSNFSRNIQGKTYNVAAFNYAIFPQASGDISLPSLTWSAKIAKTQNRNLWNYGGARYEIKRLRTADKTIKVASQPAEFPTNATWLPSSGLSLTEQWNTAPENFKVGEPITRTLTLTANGLMSSQLPTIIGSPTDARVKFYADQPELRESKGAEGVISQRVETLAVVISESGEVIIPAVSIPWWDSQANELKYAALPSRMVIVAANSDIEANAHARSEALGQPQPLTPIEPVESQQNVSILWQALAVFFMCTTLWFSVWVLRLRKNSHVKAEPENNHGLTMSANKKQAWKALQHACRGSDLNVVRTATINWANANWPLAQIHALADIARATKDSVIETQLSALDSALFSANGDKHWNPNLLMSAIKDWQEAATKTGTKDCKTLKPLYGE